MWVQERLSYRDPDAEAPRLKARGKTAMAAIAVLTIMLLAVVVVFVFRQGEADCLRLLQSAELAQGAQVRKGVFGNCRVESAPAALAAHRLD